MQRQENRIVARVLLDGLALDESEGGGNVDLILEGLAAGTKTVRIAVLVEPEEAAPRSETLVPPAACHASLFLYGTGGVPTTAIANPTIRQREAEQRTPFDRRLDVTEAVRSLPQGAATARVTLVITDLKGKPVAADQLPLTAISLAPSTERK